MKHTLTTLHGEKVSQVMSEGQDGAPIHRKARNKLHTMFVSEYLRNQEPNKVLNQRPPQINSAERNLPRHARSTLAQLRSGYSKSLNSYLSRINPRIPNRCPHCKRSPHDTRHLFNCTSKPVSLDLLSLWNDPVEAATQLELLIPEQRTTARQ